MKTIHSLSSVTPVPELDLFGVPPTQLSIERDLKTLHRPVSILNSTSAITFVIPSAIDEYIHMRDMLLYMKVQVKLKKISGNLTTGNWDSTFPVNYMLHSMFKQIDLDINGKIITSTPQTYPYKAYIETLLGFTPDAKESHLTGALWYDDETTRSTLVKPAGTTQNGKVLEMVGKLHFDMSFQPRALLGGSTVKIMLYPHDPKFYIQTSTECTASVDFLDASLIVHRAKVTPPIVEAHAMALKSGTAKYPIRRGEVRTFCINKDNNNAIIDNVVHGQLPRRAIVAMVDSDAFTGSFTKNPFSFENNKLNYLSAHLDGVQYPAIAYSPDFANDHYIREYYSFFEALNMLSTDSNMKIDRQKWKDGHTMFAFNFAPDSSEGCGSGEHVNVIRHGTMRLDMKFAEALSKTINVLVYCEYDNLVEMNENREVATDYV